ncbi:catechol 2,3-dioxygenase-like lactoylglutathione lyase family enzyme [Rhizobium rosettiformans]|uniref:Catechol 2,3-dioxygenase-like lactoylglutathione lyase family enzyme n=1 Tax=Rhizobium rosettiformans TaxID=1368430 RepID=A0A7W8HTP1_9HYPH|nr:VOC family protein [Rhizobium rosettiformans]MBB5278105.1 catechol 2,3-dioxygenase-like lactoylglutathione lyase family enzyme [Rhizobium rosettiformans]
MTVPFSLVGIDHVVFIVDDMDKALRFYHDVLGCRPGYSYPALGMEQVWCGAALIVLWDITHPGGQRPPHRYQAVVMSTTSASLPAPSIMTSCARISPATVLPSTAKPCTAAPAAWAIPSM